MSLAADTVAPVTPGGSATDFTVFEELESQVRSYCRKFPVVFQRAVGAELFSEDGRRYIDFFCGAGSLNYGHNNGFIKRRVLDYLDSDGIMHGLDMYTVAKREFLRTFDETVLRPLGLGYKAQFCGPTGTDAVEAALKLARKATGRRGIIAFTGAYHGMSRGSLAATGNLRARRAGGVGTGEVTFVPYETGPAGSFDSVGLIEHYLTDPLSGVDKPAAVIVEPMQMEGGVYPASRDWLGSLRELTERHGVLLIVDEIQSGCGRTGRFFCFEHAGIVPDIVTVSKSLGGIGMPVSITLFRRGLDVWEPGEHSGTFRGNQLAFVAATAACELWQSTKFRADLAAAMDRLGRFRADLGSAHPDIATRGIGMALGLDFGAAGGPGRADRVQRHAFEHGLIIELCGRRDEVVKLLPPVNIDLRQLNQGLDVLSAALRAA
jgi:diaminobutyrate-2-oxoglutarate transaminase